MYEIIIVSTFIGVIMFGAGVAWSNPYFSKVFKKNEKNMLDMQEKYNNLLKDCEDLVTAVNHLKQENDEWRDRYEEILNELDVYETLIHGNKELAKQYYELKSDLEEKG